MCVNNVTYCYSIIECVQSILHTVESGDPRYHQALTEYLLPDIVYVHPDIPAAVVASDLATVLSLIHSALDVLHN